jgi:hypothetical protein
VAHFSVEKPAQFRVETNNSAQQPVHACPFLLIAARKASSWFL